jgi:hypothetical protein
MSWFTFGAILLTADFTSKQTLSSQVAVLTLGPSAVLAVVTGLALAAGSPWGLTRYWWVVAKLVGTAVLCAFGTVTLTGVLGPSAMFAGRFAALLLLFVLLMISVAKPRARVRYGRPPRYGKGGR